MTKIKLHPRNPHRDLYDFQKLVIDCPQLAEFVAPNSYGNESIDFANPAAVKALNKAILKSFYNIVWDIPDNFLCPPIPGRADYIHYVADLLSNKGKNVLVLDIGVGANCIYPLIGHREYGWRFVGTEIDSTAVANAGKIIKQNGLEEAIEIRLQKSPQNIFKGVLKEPFDLSLCNPPFHSSLREAEAGMRRKWRNLKVKSTSLNFGGQHHELWCPGGEAAFIKRMVEESCEVDCKWFTTLVSKAATLPIIYRALDKVNPIDVKTIEMGQGQKTSRIVAWTFQNP